MQQKPSKLPRPVNPVTAAKLAEIAAAMRLARQQKAAGGAPINRFEVSPVAQDSTLVHTTDKHGNLITYNEKQTAFVNLAASGTSCILLGAAGTGKTTCMKGSIAALIASGRAGILESGGHKYLTSGRPGVVVVAYTRRATANIRRNLSEDMRDNCITIHKLLEYEPVMNEVTDDASGESRSVMTFEPTRNAARPLPESIRCIVFEESSMIGTELYQQVRDACPHPVQEIFLGDIQQLPPVFGPAILGFKMLELPTIELTQVYRQALESPIIRLAHRVLDGTPMPATSFKEHSHPDLVLHPWKKKIIPEAAINVTAQFFIQNLESGGYVPETDIILCPYNKAFGTEEINAHIANYLAHKRGADVYEIIAGYNKRYFSVGDKVLVDKEDGVIVEIRRNPTYLGVLPQKHSPNLTYWGNNTVDSDTGPEMRTDDDIDSILESLGSVEERVNQASHHVIVRMDDGERRVTLKTSRELNELSLGYAITVHKSQGSEWDKVFLVLHNSHNTMIQRELLYTAVTRAKKSLYVICEPDHFERGITRQRIKGDTLEEKAEFFKGKLDRGDMMTK